MRLFVAVNCSPSVQRAIWAAAAPLREAKFPIRWVQSGQIHLTVKFLGKVEPAGVEPISRALADIGKINGPFGLPVTGFGAFPTAEKARIVWAGCEPVREMEILQHEVESVFAALGFPPEGKPFRPHLTLGRVRRDSPKRLSGLEPILENLALFEEVAVTSVDLMESHLGPTGARYEKISTAELSR